MCLANSHNLWSRHDAEGKREDKNELQDLQWLGAGDPCRLIKQCQYGTDDYGDDRRTNNYSGQCPITSL